MSDETASTSESDHLAAVVEAVLIADSRRSEAIPIALADALDQLRRCRYGTRPPMPADMSPGVCSVGLAPGPGFKPPNMTDGIEIGISTTPEPSCDCGSFDGGHPGDCAISTTPASEVER